MKIAASILDCKDRINSVIELNRTNISYVHIDVMDGKFVPSVHFDNIGEIRGINLVSKYPMDVHLMIDNPSDYIKELGNMNIEFITIHLEIDKDLKEIFKSIKDLGYKVGLSIKPNTNVKDIIPYLDDIDMVLVMSVEPGLGGQSFIESTVDRIKELKELIGSRNILIEVDGGINNETITKLEGVDIAVVGSYIVKSDNYYERIEELLNTNRVVNEESINKLNFQKKQSNFLYYISMVVGILLIIIFWLINGDVKIDYYGVVLSIYLIGYIMLGYGFTGITSIDNLNFDDIKRKKMLCGCLLMIFLIIGLLLLVNALIFSYNLFNVSIFMFIMFCFFSWHVWLIVILFIIISLIRLNEIKRLIDKI